MLQLKKNIFTLLISVLILTACGADDNSGVSENTGSVEYPSVSKHAAEMEASYNSIQGNESEMFPIPVSVLTSFGAVTGDILGFAYCLPTDLYITPVASNSPPMTVYGCNNNVQVTHTITANNASVVFTWTMPELYVDFKSSVPIIGNVNGYTILTNTLVSVEVALIDNGKSLFLYGDIDATSLIYETESTKVDSVLVQSMINQLDVVTLFSGRLLNYYSAQTNSYTSTLPTFLLD